MSDTKEIDLFGDEPEHETGSRSWMLLFKASDTAQPVCVLGTLDYCYEELDALRAKYPHFLFATMYRPDGSIHRGFKPNE